MLVPAIAAAVVAHDHLRLAGGEALRATLKSGGLAHPLAAPEVIPLADHALPGLPENGDDLGQIAVVDRREDGEWHARLVALLDVDGGGRQPQGVVGCLEPGELVAPAELVPPASRGQLVVPSDGLAHPSARPPELLRHRHGHVRADVRVILGQALTAGVVHEHVEEGASRLRHVQPNHRPYQLRLPRRDVIVVVAVASRRRRLVGHLAAADQRRRRRRAALAAAPRGLFCALAVVAVPIARRALVLLLAA
mmetsp:Transcript_57565/g.166582  ORF Transcript_57565/g.166582 Transcript_57565/m.166582 type:complete len:251 (-) Transcript_57565:292-1044(-)